MARTPSREPLADPVLKRIVDLLLAKKRTQKELGRHLGINGNAITQWKRAAGKPYIPYMERIAGFLEVTPVYLAYGKPHPRQSRKSCSR